MMAKPLSITTIATHLHFVTNILILGVVVCEAVPDDIHNFVKQSGLG